MNSSRGWISVLALAFSATVWAQSGNDLIAKSLKLTIASSKTFCDGGRAVGHTGPSERMFFKLTGDWKKNLPDVDSLSVAFSKSRADQASVFFKVSTSPDAALREIGLGRARLGPVVRAAPKKFQGQPLTPEMLATYPAIQTISGFRIPGVAHAQIVTQTGHEPQVIFWGK